MRQTKITSYHTRPKQKRSWQKWLDKAWRNDCTVDKDRMCAGESFHSAIAAGKKDFACLFVAQNGKAMFCCFLKSYCGARSPAAGGSKLSSCGGPWWFTSFQKSSKQWSLLRQARVGQFSGASVSVSDKSAQPCRAARATRSCSFSNVSASCLQQLTHTADAYSSTGRTIAK